VSQFPVIVINPGAGADTGMGGRQIGAQSAMAAASRQEGARQFDVSTQQQGQQFQQSQEQQARQFEQQKQLQKQQLALAEKQARFDREQALIENAWVAKRQSLAARLEQLQSQMTNAVMADDVDILNDAYSQIDDVTSELARTEHDHMRVSVLDRFVRANAMGEIDPVTNQPKAPLIQTEFSEALQTHLFTEDSRARDLMEALGQAIIAPSSRKGPERTPVKADDPDWAKKVSDNWRKEHGKNSLPDVPSVSRSDLLDPLGIGESGRSPWAGQKTTPPAEEGLADAMVLHLAPHLGLSPEEEKGFRTMLQGLQKATLAGTTGDTATRDAELEGASKMAQQLVEMGVEPDKLAMVFSGLQRAGAEGRLSYGERLSQADLAKQMGGQRMIPASMSDEDRAHYARMEKMGALAFSLRGKEGKYVFNPSSVEQVDVDGVDPEGKPTKQKVLRRKGPTLSDVLPQATADFIEHGDFRNREKYLKGLPTGLKERVEEILNKKEAEFKNTARMEGFDPENLDYRKELSAVKTKEEELSKKKRFAEKDVTVRRAKSRIKASKDYTQKAGSVTEEALRDMEGRMGTLESLAE